MAKNPVFISLFRLSNPDVIKFMKEHNMTGKPQLLEAMYLDKLFKIIETYPTNKNYAGMTMELCT